MAEDLPSFTSWVFGFGSGVFFWGYFLLEIPGTLIVERWSARKWICRIMVTWGFVAALTAFVTNPMQFYVIRFLLGLAESGFFPGVIVYLSHWFTSKDRARALSYFFIASPVAMMIGPAVSQLFLEIGRTRQVDGVLVTAPMLLGLKGWQWIYIFGGIPAVIAGFIVLLFLTDRPKQARWLTEKERDALESELQKERDLTVSAEHHSWISGFLDIRVWLLAMIYFGIVTANYGIEIFLPSVLKQWYSLEPSQVALLAIIPSLLVIPAQLFVGWSSDKHK